MNLLNQTKHPWRLDNARFWASVGDFYKQESIAAWDGKVPSQITNNPNFAYLHAKLILSYMLDCRQQGYTGKFVLMECGAGLGKFAYYFLLYLQKLLAIAHIPEDQFRYVLCDQVDATIAFWQSQPQLAPLIASGLLQTAHLSIDTQLAVHCDFPTTELQDARVILLSNYCFDSLYQSPFILEKDDYIPCRILQKKRFFSTTTHGLTFKPDRTATRPYSTCPHYDTVLDAHKAHQVKRTLMPDGPIALVQWLQEKTIHPLLIVASDKGFAHFSHDRYGENFTIVDTGIYASCINFFAFSRYLALAHDGSSLLAPNDQVMFATHLFMTRGQLRDYPLLNLEAHGPIQQTGTHPAAVTFQLALEQATDIQDLFGLFAHGRWDPLMLNRLFEVTEAAITHSTSLDHIDIDHAIDQFLQHYYFTPHMHAMDELICIGHLALLAKRFDKANTVLDYFKQLHGVNYHYNRLCGTYYFLQSSFSSAAHYFTESLENNPDCQTSRAFLNHCEALL